LKLANLRTLGQLDQDEVRDWLARASLYVLPARYEPFGLSPLEAALAGCPLVLGDIESLREVWGEAAVFVPPDNAAMYASVLNRLIERPEQRRELAQAAHMRAKRYSPETMAQAYFQAYNYLLAQAGTPSALNTQLHVLPLPKGNAIYHPTATPGI
jgi:glycosyltransferase involved in cell wall biosynthesis